MASVYRATDLTRGCEVALKQLTVDAHRDERASLATLFEREFHTLTQLRHPHVITVYDFGIAEAGPYYTMELLDGGDLRERAPLPYREACRLLFEVCSSLALLHSRRLLHRDIGPRNIRCTKDGRAKLIDFGAMAPMSSGGGDVVGTPAFTAPETLHRSAVDARTDLFSVGVTLYYALTGRLPYAAKTFADVIAAWGCKVVPPSVLVPELPVALDDLVLALISIEPASRPQTAFDVMQQLAACADIRSGESDAVSRAYLVTPTLIGRNHSLALVTEKLTAASHKHGSAVMVQGEPGVGRSRFLDAVALQAQTLGFTVARASAAGALAAFGLMQVLTARLLDGLSGLRVAASFPELFAEPRAGAAPVLRDFADAQLEPARVRDALCRLLLTVSRSHRLLIAVDDLQRIDTPSAAVLAELIDKSRRSAVVVAFAVSSDQSESEVLRALAARCEKIQLTALDRTQTRELLAAMFGNAAHLEMLAGELYGLTRGNPRECIEVSQYLVDRGVIRYASGTWTIPAQLTADQLPRSSAEATRARIAGLSSHARLLAEAHALAFYESLAEADYRLLLPDARPLAIDDAVAELLTLGALVRNGKAYSLSNRVWAAIFAEGLSDGAARERHRMLASVYKASDRLIACIHHTFSGELFDEGMKLLALQHSQHLEKIDNRRILEQNVGKMVWCTGVAIEIAVRQQHPARAIAELRRWHYAGELTTQHPALNASGPLWRAQLVRDSGLELYWADTSNDSPGERLMRALHAVQQRYSETPPE
ncbi:MAG TPA: protein kinase, partial [Polyangiales bacterium]|nr:protein kinase [Polyangiales bacterium]